MPSSFSLEKETRINPGSWELSRIREEQIDEVRQQPAS